MSISIDEFKNFIIHKLKNIKTDYIELNSGDIHREIGEYPSKSHSMPNCCSAMRELMNSKDIVLFSPLKGNGATLKVRYYKR